jgi:hypothetical protein
MADITRLRTVCGYVKVTYTGAPLNAAGLFTIGVTSGLNVDSTMNTIATAVLNDPLSRRVSARKLMRGIVIPLRSSGMGARAFEHAFDSQASPNLNYSTVVTDNGYAPSPWRQIHVIGTGLASDAIITYELVRYIEGQADPGTTLRAFATPQPTADHPLVKKLTEMGSSLIHDAEEAMGAIGVALGGVAYRARGAGRALPAIADAAAIV